eukprot:6464856-Amphidinium_carterae.1
MQRTCCSSSFASKGKSLSRGLLAMCWVIDAFRGSIFVLVSRLASGSAIVFLEGIVECLDTKTGSTNRLCVWGSRSIGNVLSSSHKSFDGSFCRSEELQALRPTTWCMLLRHTILDGLFQLLCLDDDAVLARRLSASTFLEGLCGCHTALRKAL